jgi:hypothetical protein
VKRIRNEISRLEHYITEVIWEIDKQPEREDILNALWHEGLDVNKNSGPS